MQLALLKTKNETQMAGLFDRIASYYDRTNHLMSMGIDRLWRKALVASLKKASEQKPFRVIDIACGTGDVSFALAKTLQAHVAGMDISQGMLAVAEKKSEKFCSRRTTCEKPQFIRASATKIPFEEAVFDAATMAFSIRNFEHRDACLAEILRVLKPGKTLAVLEFALPSQPVLKALYNLYLRGIIPLFGWLHPKNRQAYRYLSRSIGEFPRYETLCREFEQAGFCQIAYRKLSGGIAVLYTAVKP